MPQAVAEMALLKAAGEGDLASLERLVSQGVDVDAMDAVRATFVPPRHPRLRSVPPTALAHPRPPSASRLLRLLRLRLRRLRPRPTRPQPNLTPPPSPRRLPSLQHTPYS